MTKNLIAGLLGLACLTLGPAWGQRPEARPDAAERGRGADQLFERLDADGDGVIDRAEAEKLAAMLRRRLATEDRGRTGDRAPQAQRRERPGRDRAQRRPAREPRARGQAQRPERAEGRRADRAPTRRRAGRPEARGLSREVRARRMMLYRAMQRRSQAGRDADRRPRRAEAPPPGRRRSTSRDLQPRPFQSRRPERAQSNPSRPRPSREAILKRVDRDGNGRLDPAEREALRLYLEQIRAAR